MIITDLIRDLKRPLTYQTKIEENVLTTPPPQTEKCNTIKYLNKANSGLS